MAEKRAVKRADMNALRALPASDLAAQIDTLRKERWEHRIKMRDGSVRQTHQLGVLRRQVARVLTAMNEQHRAAGSQEKTS